MNRMPLHFPKKAAHMLFLGKKKTLIKKLSHALKTNPLIINEVYTV